MKEYFVRFVRKHTKALALSLFSIMLLIVSALGLHGAITAKAEEATKPDVLTMLDGKEHPYVFVNEKYIEELLELKDNYHPHLLKINYFFQDIQLNQI